MTRTYDWVLAIHVLAAVIWVGGAFTAQMLGIVVQRTQDGARVAGFARDIEKVSMRTYIPAALVLIVTGPWLVSNAGFAWEGWLIFAIVVWAVSALTGSLYIGPTAGRVAKTVEAEGPDSPLARRLLGNIFLVSRAELVLLILVILDMVLKPGL